MRLSEIDQKFASWQGETLWTDTAALAVVRKDPGVGGWTVWITDRSPLHNPEVTDDILNADYDSHVEARRVVNDLARKAGYRIITNKKGLERFKAANPGITGNVTEEASVNPIKAKLAAELAKLDGGDAPRYNVPGYRQKSGGLNLASEAQSWSRNWRERALEDLPDSVAKVESVEATVRTSKTGMKTVKFLIFKDAAGQELLAVIPKLSNNIYKYALLKPGQTIAGELGAGWHFR